MQALVTGTAGLVGSHVAKALLARGDSVIGVDNFAGGYKDNVPVHPNYEHYAWDIRAINTVPCDTVFHCAALAYEGLSVFSPRLISENIVGGTAAVMVAAVNGGAKTFVNFSSMARYGRRYDPPFMEWHTPMPIDPYGISKLAAEHLLDSLGSAHGIRVLHIVPHNIIGPGQRYDDPYRNVVGIMLNRALQNKPLLVYGDGLQTRCFSFVQDVVPTVLAIATSDAPHGSVYNVGPDEGEVTILKLAEVVSRICGVAPNIEHLADRPCEVKHAWCSSDRIRTDFGFEQKTSLCDGITIMRDWIVERGVLDFDYSLPIELHDSPLLPLAWKQRML